MELQNYYNYRVAEELIKADQNIDLVAGIGTHEQEKTNFNISRKRSRNEFLSDDRLKFFSIVVKEWDHAALFPAFKTYLDTKFNTLLAKVISIDKLTDYTALLQNVSKFRNIMECADKHFYKEEYQHVYSLLSETMFHHLLVTKDMIFSFSKCASRVLAHFE